MDLLGSAVDGNGAQIFVLTDAARATGWRGTNNGKGEANEGSDWAAAFEAFYGTAPDEDIADESTSDARAVEVSGDKVDLVDFGTGGWSLVYRAGDTLVLVDGSFEDEREAKSLVGDEENVPAGKAAKAFEEYVAAPPSKKAKGGHVIDVPSGWLVAMSATAAFAELDGDAPPSLEKLAKQKKGVLQVDDADGGHALFFQAPAKKYAVFVEEETEAKWGSAARVILRPA